MLFEIIEMPPVADRAPLPGEEWLCQDWNCPAWMSCKRHHGRSYDYASMADPMERAYSLLRPGRFEYAAHCSHYELDRPREWLKGWCTNEANPCPGCDAPECAKRNSVVPFRRKRDAPGGSRPPSTMDEMKEKG